MRVRLLAADIERENKVAICADVWSQPSELRKVRLQFAQLIRRIQRDEQPRTALHHHLEGCILLQTRAGNAERVEYLSAVMIGNSGAERRRTLREGDAKVAVGLEHIHFDH